MANEEEVRYGVQLGPRGLETTKPQEFRFHPVTEQWEAGSPTFARFQTGFGIINIDNKKLFISSSRNEVLMFIKGVRAAYKQIAEIVKS